MTTKSEIGILVSSSLRSIAASVPVAASLAQAWSEYEAHLKGQRVAKLFQDLKKDLESVQHKIHSVESYIGSESFVGLIEEVVERVQKESSSYKRRVFERLLVGSIIAGDSIAPDNKMSALYSLDTLTENDLQLLMKFSRNWSIRLGELESFPNGNTDTNAFGNVVASFCKLESRGILFKKIEEDPPEGSWYLQWQWTYGELLPAGKQLLDLLSW